MDKCYINGISTIGAQDNFQCLLDGDFILNTSENVLSAKPQDYKQYISPGDIRRMSKGVKMGILTSLNALKEAGIENIDSIITGSGMGCLQDSEKFLSSVIDNEEQYLTPTSFIQSTHNTVGSKIALNLGCKGYNFTYIQGSVSFESALLDAKMQIEEGENSILVGGVDENADHNLKLYKLINYIKKEEDTPFSVLNSKTKGSVFGEGASFFVIENQKKESTYSELVDLEIINKLEKNEVENTLISFLNQNDLTLDDIDAVVLGLNGEVGYDDYYTDLINNEVLKSKTQLYFKHLSGEYNTSSSFAFWLSSFILKEQKIPDCLFVNDIKKQSYSTILIYNQYRGENHSFVLLRK